VRIGTSSKGMIFVATISDKRVLRSMNRLIHPSAWKWNSANFAKATFSEMTPVECSLSLPHLKHLVRNAHDDDQYVSGQLLTSRMV
jgi:hypothetical protein